MKKSFYLRRQFSGYSRGEDSITVEAESLEQAVEIANDSWRFDREVVRDDREEGEWEEY